MKFKLPDLIMLVVFMLVISAPLFSSLPAPAFIWDQIDPSQQSFSIFRLAKTLVEFPPAYISYFDSHYLLHQEQVHAFQSVSYHLLHEKVFPNVLIAKRDWLFYTGENNIDDYECTAPFTAEELQTIRARLLDWNAQLQERGIHFYIVIAPNKETVYPQYLPDQVKPGPNACRIDQVMQTLQATPLVILDLSAPLQKAAQTAQVYHRTDTHWNDTGALLASQNLLSLVIQDFPEVTVPSNEDYQREIQPFSGDLAAFLPEDNGFIEQEIFLSPVRQSPAKIEEGADRTILSALPVSTLPSAVIFRDSFSDALIPFLSDHLSHIVYVHSFGVDLDLIDQEKPDIVIFEIAQRYLTVLR